MTVALIIVGDIYSTVSIIFGLFEFDSVVAGARVLACLHCTLALWWALLSYFICYNTQLKFMFAYPTMIPFYAFISIVITIRSEHKSVYFVTPFYVRCCCCCCCCHFIRVGKGCILFDCISLNQFIWIGRFNEMN